MTGERELAAGETSSEIRCGGPDRERSGGAKNPTLRTLGSITARGALRASMTKIVDRLGFVWV